MLSKICGGSARWRFLGVADVSPAILDADRQCHVINGRATFALDIRRKCLERGNIERVQAFVGTLGQFDRPRAANHVWHKSGKVFT